MMTSKVEEFLILASIDEIIDWISNNPNLLYHHIDSIENRINKLEVDPSGEEVARLINVLILKGSIELPDYRLIKCISNKALSIGVISKIIIDTSPYVSMVGLFESIDNILNDKFDVTNLCLDQIYHDIIDIYIPTDDPDRLIQLFSDNFSLKDILVNRDSEWFYDKYQNSCLVDECMMKDMLLLFKHVVDIFTNEESRYEHTKRLQIYYSKTYVYSNKFNEICDRYYKYFKDDTRYIVSQLIELVLSKSVDDDTEKFLIEWSSKYSGRANTSIIRCLINDTIALVNMIPESDKVSLLNVENISGNILSKWGNQQYNVVQDFDSLEELSNDDKPISYLMSIATEAVHKDSAVINNAEKKIYKAYKNYKEAEEKVDSQITKALNGIKGVVTGDVRTEVIEGKKFSAIGLLKQLLRTVAIFSYSKIAGVIAIVVKYALKKKTTNSERRKIIMELETEIELIDEKIADAKSDGNRDAKYSMMRTKKDLEHALNRIQYGMEAETKATRSAKEILDKSRGGA